MRLMFGPRAPLERVRIERMVAVACVCVVVVACLAGSGVASGAVSEGGRAFELVSPAQKNGGDIAADSQRARAAADGSAVQFMSLTGFGDVQGAEIATDYVSVRDGRPGDSGWSTHGITPPQDPMTLEAALQGADPYYAGEFSPDLSTGIFRAWSPVTGDPNVANVENLYVRHDLRSAGVGSYQLASNCPLCEHANTPLEPLALTGPQLPLWAGSSADFSHVLFESKLNLTADAPAQPGGCATSTALCEARLYESVDGQVRLAGVLPDGSAAEVSLAGAGAGLSHPSMYTPHTISSDGRRITFTVPGFEHKPGELDPTGSSGRLYQRVDGSSTLRVDASERTDCADHNPCSGTPELDPTGEWASTYQDASADGTRVFFVSHQALTDDAVIGRDSLYMWDATAPSGHRLRLVSKDQNASDGGDVSMKTGCGVVGVSDDGTRVYFIAQGQLVAGAPTLGTDAGLYVWHDEGGGVSSTKYVGKLKNLNNGGIADQQHLLWTTNWKLGAWHEARVSPDGRRLLFMSSSGEGLLSAHGGSDIDQSACTGGCQTFYLYDAETERLWCASCSSEGKVVANAQDVIVTNDGSAATTPHLSRALSDDGEHAFFMTTGALVPGDANGTMDAYEFNASTGTVSLVSTGTDPADSYFMDASADGSNAFFLTRQKLVGWDTDENYDMYDARTGGGFPEPVAALPACNGETCQGALTNLPVAITIATNGFQGAGNTQPPVTVNTKKRTIVKCKQGFVRKRVHGRTRCVRRPRAKHARSGGRRA